MNQIAVPQADGSVLDIRVEARPDGRFDVAWRFPGGVVAGSVKFMDQAAAWLDETRRQKAKGFV